MPERPLVVIAGPTASGKTSLAIEIAKRCHGEIICADSRTIYKYLDIGTAKPTKKEQAEVPHWGLDLVEPNERFSVSDFKNYANKKIAEIRARGNTPFLVGGTGLYIDAVIFDYKFGPKANDGLRQKLQQLTVLELQDYCYKNNIKLPENSKNKRYLIRAIEMRGQKKEGRQKPIDNCIIVGITTEKEALRSRIVDRIGQMLDNGLIKEAEDIGAKFDCQKEALKADAYPIIFKYLKKEIELSDVKSTLATLDWRLAKRQLTWMRRNKFIQWLSLDDAKKYLLERLATNEQTCYYKTNKVIRSGK